MTGMGVGGGSALYLTASAGSVLAAMEEEGRPAGRKKWRKDWRLWLLVVLLVLVLTLVSASWLHVRSRDQARTQLSEALTSHGLVVEEYLDLLLDASLVHIGSGHQVSAEDQWLREVLWQEIEAGALSHISVSLLRSTGLQAVRSEHVSRDDLRDLLVLVNASEYSLLIDRHNLLGAQEAVIDAMDAYGAWLPTQPGEANEALAESHSLLTDAVSRGREALAASEELLDIDRTQGDLRNDVQEGQSVLRALAPLLRLSNSDDGRELELWEYRAAIGTATVLTEQIDHLVSQLELEVAAHHSYLEDEAHFEG